MPLKALESAATALCLMSLSHELSENLEPSAGRAVRGVDAAECVALVPCCVWLCPQDALTSDSGM